jgi:hypothetical protein
MLSREDAVKNYDLGQLSDDFIELDRGGDDSLDIGTRDAGLLAIHRPHDTDTDIPGLTSFNGPYYYDQQDQFNSNDASRPPLTSYDMPPHMNSNANSSAAKSVDLAAELLLAQKRAKENIRKGVLYKSGANGRIPKTKVADFLIFFAA